MGAKSHDKIIISQTFEEKQVLFAELLDIGIKKKITYNAIVT